MDCIAICIGQRKKWKENIDITKRFVWIKVKKIGKEEETKKTLVKRFFFTTLLILCKIEYDAFVIDLKFSFKCFFF